MRNRTYIRRLRNSCLRQGYISRSVFKGIVPQKLFVCIWPSDPNIKERASLIVRSTKEEKHLALKTHAKKEGKCILKFDKTASVFDKSGFFWTAAKGHNFQVESQIEENEIIFCAAHFKNKNRYFLDMLDVISIEQEEISLKEYMEQKFDTVGKNTYAFAVYLHVKFWSKTVKFGDSEEVVYCFDDLSPFFAQKVNISNVLYEYNVQKASDKNRAISLQPEIVEIYGAKVHNDNIKTDVKQVLKDCITPFIQEFKDKEPTEEDYLCLVEEMLGNLSKL